MVILYACGFSYIFETIIVAHTVFMVDIVDRPASCVHRPSNSVSTQLKFLLIDCYFDYHVPIISLDDFFSRIPSIEDGAPGFIRE